MTGEIDLFRFFRHVSSPGNWDLKQSSLRSRQLCPRMSEVAVHAVPQK